MQQNAYLIKYEEVNGKWLMENSSLWLRSGQKWKMVNGK